jgi:hypothetical protein
MRSFLWRSSDEGEVSDDSRKDELKRAYHKTVGLRPLVQSQIKSQTEERDPEHPASTRDNDDDE